MHVETSFHVNSCHVSVRPSRRCTCTCRCACDLHVQVHVYCNFKLLCCEDLTTILLDYMCVDLHVQVFTIFANGVPHGTDHMVAYM